MAGSFPADVSSVLWALDGVQAQVIESEAKAYGDDNSEALADSVTSLLGALKTLLGTEDFEAVLEELGYEPASSD